MTFRQAQPAVGNIYAYKRFKIAITGELPTPAGPRSRALFMRVDCALCARTTNKRVLYMTPADFASAVIDVDKHHECFNGAL